VTGMEEAKMHIEFSWGKLLGKMSIWKTKKEKEG
jgi:hypothetical protein